MVVDKLVDVIIDDVAVADGGPLQLLILLLF